MSGRPRAPGYLPPHGAQRVTLTPAALLGEPPVARGTLSALEPRRPRPAAALPALGMASGALSGWSTGTGLAAAAALEAEVSVLWHGHSVAALPRPQDPCPPLLQPLHTQPCPPRWPYLAAVTARPCHTRLAQAAPGTGVAALGPTGGAVTPCRRWGCDNGPSPHPCCPLTVPSCPPSLQSTRSQRGRTPDRQPQSAPGPGRGGCGRASRSAQATPRAYGSSCQAARRRRRSRARTSRSEARRCVAGSRGRRLSAGRSP